MNTPYFTSLLDYLIAADTTQMLEQKLIGLLTPAEIQAISLRLQITQRLKAGMPQRQIAKELGVGIATVTRGSKELKAGKL